MELFQIANIFTRFLPISQLLPWCPCLHLHLYRLLLVTGKQVPPFKHGLLWHSLISVSQNSPVHPNEHSHLQTKFRSCSPGSEVCKASSPRQGNGYHKGVKCTSNSTTYKSFPNGLLNLESLLMSYIEKLCENKLLMLVCFRLLCDCPGPWPRGHSGTAPPQFLCPTNFVVEKFVSNI